MRFSQRIGKRPVKAELEKEGLSEELRNTLWSITLELVINKLSNEKGYREYSDLSIYYRSLWINFF
jgi:hypothetical protein